MDDGKHKNMAIISLLQAIDSDEEDFLIAMACNYESRRKRRRIAIKNYIQDVVYHFNFDEFKSHFRIRRQTFEDLLRILGPFLRKRYVNRGAGRETHPPEKQLLVALCMLANQEVYRIIAEKFDISKSTAWSYVKKICCILTDRSHDYIIWPSGDYVQKVIKTFQNRSQFPGVLGAIDGSHIPITPPLNEQAAYCNRKGYHSIILQAVCDGNYMFTDVFAGYPGRVHDARVFHNSPLGKKIKENPLELFPHYNIHILGDSAYRCTQHVLTPFKDNGHLTRKQKTYNYKHSSTRVVIEQAFGQLKERFRILKHIHVFDTKFIPKIILTCCVLHNICVKQNDILEVKEYEEYYPQDVNNERDVTGFTKRDIANIFKC